MRRDQSVGCRRSRNHPSARQSGGVYRSRTVVVVVPSLAVRVVVVRSRSAPPSAPSSILANDARVRIAPARVLLSRKSRYGAGRRDPFQERAALRPQLDTGQRLQRAHGARLFYGVQEVQVRCGSS